MFVHLYLFRWFTACPKTRGPSQTLLRYLEVHRSKPATCPLGGGQLTLPVSHSTPSLLFLSPQNWATRQLFTNFLIIHASFIYFGEEALFSHQNSFTFSFSHPSPTNPAGHSDVVYVLPRADQSAASHEVLTYPVHIGSIV